MTVCAKVNRPPPPRPCTARPMTSTSMFGAMALISDPARKMSTAA